MKPVLRVTAGVLVVVLTTAFHTRTDPKITHSVTGNCDVTQTLTIDNVKHGDEVVFEFLPQVGTAGDGSSSRQDVTSTTQTFTFPRTFTAAETGAWWARAELLYSKTKPPYSSMLSFTVAC
jgi:hypothetical protein